MFITGTYIRDPNEKSIKLPLVTFFKALSAIIPCALIIYILGPETANNYFGRGVLVSGIFVFGIISTVSRVVLNKLYYINQEKLNLLYLGDPSLARNYLLDIKKHIHNQTIHSLISPNSELSNAVRYVDSEKPLYYKTWDSVIIGNDFTPTSQQSKELVQLRLNGSNIGSIADYFEDYLLKIPVSKIADDFFINSKGFSMINSVITTQLKRVIDIISSIIIIFFSIPVILIVSILIKRDSKGPIFYSQNRTGLNGKDFKIYKLRTMTQDAENKGVKWAEVNDPRITSIGQFLRKSRLDEIPQCWNVLKGDMSLIGPRPERPEFIQSLSKKIPYYDLRHLVKPGLSGWAQVMYPYGSSTDDSLKKLEYDLYYIKNQSMYLDLSIALRTILTVVNTKGR